MAADIYNVRILLLKISPNLPTNSANIIIVARLTRAVGFVYGCLYTGMFPVGDTSCRTLIAACALLTDPHESLYVRWVCGRGPIHRQLVVTH